MTDPQQALAWLRSRERKAFVGMQQIQGLGMALEPLRACPDATAGVDCIEVIPEGDSFVAFRGRWGGDDGVPRFLMGLGLETNGRDGVALEVSLALSTGDQSAEDLFSVAAEGGARRAGNYLLSPQIHHRLLELAWCNGVDQLVATPAYQNSTLRRLWIERGFEPTDQPRALRLLLTGRTEVEREESNVCLRRAFRSIEAQYQRLRLAFPGVRFDLDP